MFCVKLGHNLMIRLLIREMSMEKLLFGMRLLEIMLAVIDGTLDRIEVEWSDGVCVGVVLASGGYPGSYNTSFPIEGLDSVDNDIIVFHAGTKVKGGQIVTDGGRVLTVAATGKTMAEARARVYDNIPHIHFDGCHYRKDIAAREVEVKL